MKEITVEPRKATDKFYVIVREDVRNPSNMCDGFKMDDGNESHHYMYSNRDEAIERCKEYMRKRKHAGENYRYYVLESIAVIRNKEAKDELPKGE